MEEYTFFELEDGTSYGNHKGILPITLFKGMLIKIEREGMECRQVLNWYYVHAHPDKDAGLHIVLK